MSCEDSEIYCMWMTYLFLWGGYLYPIDNKGPVRFQSFLITEKALIASRDLVMIEHDLQIILPA